jgi:hypothetical protein
MFFKMNPCHFELFKYVPTAQSCTGVTISSLIPRICVLLVLEAEQQCQATAFALLYGGGIDHPVYGMFWVVAEAGMADGTQCPTSLTIVFLAARISARSSQSRRTSGVISATMITSGVAFLPARSGRVQRFNAMRHWRLRVRAWTRSRSQSRRACCRHHQSWSERQNVSTPAWRQ